jgi:arginyl-tRNA synthetase
MERFAEQAVQQLNQVLENPITISELETPPDPKMGDFGFPCFRLAKAFKKSPPQVALQIADDIKRKNLKSDLVVAAVGPYVNFTVPPEVAMNSLLKDILNTDYGKLTTKKRGTWVLEFSSPNVAKPLNIYHLRPTALGAALDRIGRYRGFNVVSINHLGDWGKQYGMLTVAFEKYGKKVSDNLTMMELVDLYVKINADAEKDKTLDVKAREAFLKLEKNDAQVTALW